MKVQILLATYNSEKYLWELLDSLVAQSYKNWELLVHDDGSDDRTIPILKEFERKHDRSVKIYNSKNQLGPKQSFEYLLKNSSADYLMFCDHDDVWLPHKIEESLACIQKREQEKPNKPALVFSDLVVADEQLNTINPSFWNYSKVNPNNVYNCYKLLINNPAPGCTFILNKKVKELVLPFPAQARMHDWWIVLKVAESGVIDYLKRPGLLYRQHQKNKVGAEDIKTDYLLSRIANLSLTMKRNRESFEMMKCLSRDYSLIKLFYYKLRISFSKLL
ncbi:glycosyltransferase family 2 protein [Draconibacterium halophilum]|uniref:Glycosyltransferase family 2 protein n=1 Tax=Draconibacterium halophilum TaxID=2706887 RepID=A0A6C0RD30_9BACT|nr:glycosyltransferase family 2 protein [Draconibacterium halophilum]QIA08548.1 glycosyltransferase family 2 protein [Draconibacterium halophilum]